MTLDDLKAFEALVRQHYPALRVEFKDRSSTQRLLGYLMYPFNPTFMTRYTSTFAPVVYFPSKDFYEGNPKASINVLAHEWVHLIDTERHPWWFRLSYVFPQVLAPFGFLTYIVLARSHAWPLAALLVGVALSILLSRVSMAAFFLAASVSLIGSIALAIWTSGWATLALLLGFLFLAPWPAPGRVHWEQRGYAMTLAFYRWTFGYVPQILRDSIQRSFLDSSYFFMSWRKAAIQQWVNDTVGQAASGKLAEQEPYGLVYDFLRSRNLVK